MHEVQYLLVVISAVGGLICLGLARYVWEQRDVVSAEWFTAFILVAGVYNLGRAVFFASNTDAVASVAVVVPAGTAIPIPLLWLLWTASYTGYDGWITRRRLVALGVPFGAYTLFTFAEPLHGVRVSQARVATENGIRLPVPETTGASIAIWLVSLLFVFVGLGFLLRYYSEARGLFRRQAGVILLGSTLPFVANIAFLMEFSVHPGLDPTSTFIALQSVVIAWALFRYDFLDVVPLSGDVLVDQIPDPAIALDEKGRIVDHNDAAAALFDGRDVVQQSIEEFVGPIDGSAETISVDVDGEETIYDPQVTPLSDHRGIERGALLLLRDVTVQERRLETLQELQTATRQFMEAETPDGIAAEMVEAADRVLEQPYAAVFGYDDGGDSRRAVAMSEAVEALVGDATPVLTDDQFADVVDLEEPHVFDEVGGTAALLGDGATLGSSLVVPLGEHGILAITSPRGSETFTDADERFAETLGAAGRAAMDSAKRTQQLRESQQLLRRRNEQIEFFNSVLRHDLLNGINILSGKAAILEDHADDDGQEHLATIQEWAEDLSDLTVEIRSIVRAIEDDEGDSLEPVDLSAVLMSAVRKVQKAYPAAEVTADVEAGIRVTANQLLDQVVENLLMNAVEHNDSDPPRVVVSADVTGDTVSLTVADNGPGIPPERREAVFDPDVTSDASDTFGFGLYFVRTMVEKYGGSACIEEGDLSGTAVILELQRAATTADSGTDAEAER